MRCFKTIIALICFSFLLGGCVYYNTFYLAEKNFNEAESEREKNESEKAGGRSKSKYNLAIEKSTRVLTEHPDSKYVDDALYIIGKSYYHLEDYYRSERKFRELLAAFPESDYVERALLYLGKCRLQREEYILARQAFEEIDSLTDNRDFKAEAQFMLGEIQFNQRQYPEAIKYYTNYVKEYASSEDAAKVQFKIGTAYTELNKPRQAKNAFLEVAEYKPNDSLYFESQFLAGEAYYELEMVDSGYTIFEALAENERYYDKAGKIRLKLAEALEIKNEFEGAIEEYERIAVEFERTEAAAIAFYRIGEIQVSQYNNLELAKEMYDSSIAVSRGSEVYQDAIQKSADISRLGQYREEVGDENLENDAAVQYQLAELYLVQLDNPDTALVEFEFLIDSFPDSKWAARALLARAYIFEEVYNMPESAQASYNRIINDYSHTDYVEQVSEITGTNLDQLDVDYPGRRYRQAETMLFDENDPDSAMALFTSVIEDFPDSKYASKSAYARAWLMEQFMPPDTYIPDDTSFVPDSTLIFAYQEVADSFPGTPYGDSALVRLGKKVQRRQPVRREQEPEPGEIMDTLPIDSLPQDVQEESYDLFADIDALIDTLREIDEKPVKEGDFVYPPSAYYTKFEGYVSFAVRLDSFGKPVEWVILQASGNKEIDEAAEEALRYTEFDPGEIPLEYSDKWQFYRIRVELPREVKGRE
jgi:TonB family protein